jgi:hypothetical protein
VLKSFTDDKIKNWFQNRRAKLKDHKKMSDKRPVGTLRRPIPSLISNSGDFASKEPTTSSKNSRICNDTMDGVKLLQLDTTAHHVETPEFVRLRRRSSQTSFLGRDHSNFFASPILGSNSTMLSHGNSTSVDTCVVGKSFSSVHDTFAAGLREISIQTRHGLVQS